MKQMRPIEIEAWALRVLQKVNGKHPIEDSRVELKREWPVPLKAARQIAGHANAARGDDLLWLIGADETNGIFGADANELADWLPQIQAEFESVSPEIFPVAVHYGETVIMALHVRTKQAPYRVRVPAFGNVAGCPVRWETPWREGNQTRTISRSELLTMLLPKVEQPQFEILTAKGSFNPETKALVVWQKIYIVPPRDGFYVFPKHKTFLSLTLGDQPLGGKGTLYFYSSEPAKAGKTSPAGVEITDTEIIVRAPGAIECEYTFEPKKAPAKKELLKIESIFQSAHDPVQCRLWCVMQPSAKEYGRTEWHPHDFQKRSLFSVI